jgi:hypothetical protein
MSQAAKQAAMRAASPDAIALAKAAMAERNAAALRRATSESADRLHTMDDSAFQLHAARDPAAGAAAAAAAADQGSGPPPVSAWATPVGATTQAEFRAEAMAADEPQKGSGGVSRPVMWGIVLVIGAILAAAGVWLQRHFDTERELAALARVAAIPGADDSSAGQSAPEARRPGPPLPPIPAGSSATAQGIPSERTSPDRATIDRAAADPSATAPAPTDPRTVAAVTAGEPATPSASYPPPVPDSTANERALANNRQPDQALSANPGAAAPGSPARSQPIGRKPPVQSFRRPAPDPLSERAMAKLSPKAREYLYSQTFRRCPSPGLPGALQCRKHICNGAEGRTPACYHINRLNL